MSFAVACGAKRTTAKEPSLGALASDGPLGAPCSLTTTAAITAACTKIATAAAVADQASVRGVRIDRNSEMRLPRSNQRRWRGDRASSASRASMALRVSHLGGSSRQAPRGPGHIAAPVCGRGPALAPRDWRRGGSASRPRTTAAELLSPDAPAHRLSRSWPTSFDSLRLEQLRQPLARVEHARLDRVLRNTNDLGCLFDRFLVVVREIDDLPMFRRKSCEALSQHCTLILLLQRGCGIVRQIFDRGCGLFVQLLVPSTSERRNGLEARDRQQPCRYRRAPFEAASLTPHVEKYLADHVLRGSLIANETNDEPKHPHVVARI